MQDFRQGDIIQINGFRQPFVIVSKNSYIKSTGMFHVCPFLTGIKEGPVHISGTGVKGIQGVAVLEQIKLIDPGARTISKTDWLSYRDIMEMSDALQGIFEYD